jgi:TRAP transporter 4TM/12TM fusion protein
MNRSESLNGWKKLFFRPTLRETIAVFITLVYLGFQVYRTFIVPQPPLIIRPIHVASVSLLCFLYVPFKTKGKSKLVQTAANIFDVFGYLASLYLLYYHITNYDRLISRINYLDAVSNMDRIACILVIILIMGGIYRTVGKPLAIFIAIAIIYGFTAPYLPGILYYQGLDMDKFTQLMIMGNEGIYGSATSAASGFLFWMMLFGGLFSGGSCGQVLIDLGLLAGAKSKDASAPAKAAVVSSGLFGMISGSAAANVASTGVFTIPMMKKVGYTPEEAGAIEAVASTGGQIMPPIMGTAAFLMADMLEINYLKIASAALAPGLIYYGAVFLLVHLLAKKRASQNKDYAPVEFKCEPIIPRLHLLSPVVVLMGAMAMGSTIQRAALYAIFTVILLNYIDKKERRKSTLELMEMVMLAAKRTATVGMPLCGCGIIIGIITMSGLASRLSIVISTVGSQFLWIGLLITMFGCMLLGMALPTVAAYLTAYVLFMPTLLGLGIDVLPANLFIFYFGIFAQITPPVCVASYTAAGIANSDSWKTGWKAFTYALCAFLAPFVFVYQPGVLLIGPFGEIVMAIGILVAGTFMLTIGLSGYFNMELSKIERSICIISGILICLPESVTDIIGFIMAATLIGYLIMKKKKMVVTKAV